MEFAVLVASMGAVLLTQPPAPSDCELLEALMARGASEQRPARQARARRAVFHTPPFPGTTAFSDFMGAFDTVEARAAVWRSVESGVRDNPVAARAFARAQLLEEQAHIEEIAPDLDDAWVADYVRRNGDLSAWTCALPDGVTYYSEPLERRQASALIELAFSRPGVSADGQSALVRMFESLSLGEDGSTGTSVAWVRLERDNAGVWTVGEIAHLYSYEGRF
jgi:hypothetical protein